MRYRRSLILSVLSLLGSFPLLAQSSNESSYFDVAQSFYRNDQLDSATYYARQAIAFSRRQQQWNRHAYALGWLGDVYRRASQFDSALYYLQQALLTVTVNQTPDTTTATTYHNLGLYYEYTNQPEQALQMNQQALELREKLDPARPMAVATSYESLADVYRYIYFDYSTAEEYYLKVMAIYNQYEVADEKRMLRILYNLATTNRLKENYEKALEFGFKALTVAQNLRTVDQEFCYQMLGNIFSAQGESQRAIQFYQKAIDLTLALEGKLSSSLSWQYNNLAHAYLKMNSLRSAIQTLNKALSLYKTANFPSSQKDRARTYEHLGKTYAQMNQFDSASQYFQRCLELRYQFSGHKNLQTSETLEAIAEFHEKQQQSDSALVYYQRALIAGVPEFDQMHWKQNPSVSMMRNDPLVFGLLVKKANVLVKQFHRWQKTETLLTALTSFLLADSLIDICRVSYDREATKIRFSGENKAFYNQAIQCTYLLYQITNQPNYIAVAFALAEKSKAMILWDALTDAQVKHTIGVPDSVLRIERQLKRQTAFINSQWMEEVSQEKPDDTRLMKLRAEQYEIGRQQDALARILRQQYPQYFNIKYEADGQLFPAAQAYAIQHNTTLIDYFWGEAYIYAVGIDANHSRFVRIPITDSLMYTFSTYQLALQHRPSQTLSKREYRAFTLAAHTLYQQLLFPLLPHSTTPAKGFFDSFREAQNENYARSLTIIPDGPLSFLPFESLLITLPSDSVFNFKHLNYLVRTHSVGYAQSLRVLTQRTHLSDQKRPAMRFLAFSYSDSTSSAAASRSTLQSLPGSSDEIDALQAMAEVDVFKGKQATEYQFKTHAKHYNIIHLAVHGQANTSNPNNNRLVFRSETDSVEDGSLYSYELYELQLQADLTVLSTCESGMGKFQPGEGVYSLARGFAYAGCPSVVMSLWKVDDLQTARIMPDFYRTLFAGNTKDDALRTAKLNYIHTANSYSAHPYFWSAFILEGTPSAIIDYQTTSRAFWLIAVLSVLYLSLFLREKLIEKRKTHSIAIGH